MTSDQLRRGFGFDPVDRRERRPASHEPPRPPAITLSVFSLPPSVAIATVLPSARPTPRGPVGSASTGEKLGYQAGEGRLLAADNPSEIVHGFPVPEVENKHTPFEYPMRAPGKSGPRSKSVELWGKTETAERSWWSFFELQSNFEGSY